MRIFLLRLIAGMCAMFASLPAFAQSDLTVKLVAETNQPAAGRTVMLALEIVPNPGWHGYWKNPGEAGLPPKLEWTLPPGATIGAPRFPVPEKLVAFGVMNHVYEAPYALLVPLTLKPGLPVGTTLPIRLEAHLLACDDKLCRPQRARLAIVMTIGSGTAPGSSKTFDAWRQQLARPLGAEAKFERVGQKVRVAIPVPASVAIDAPWLFSANQYAFKDSAKQVIRRSGNTVFVEAEAGDDPPAARFEGLLATRDGQGFEFSATPARVQPSGDVLAGAAEKVDARFLLLALGGALLGGLLLNIMPCVFPIISLKALSLTRIGSDQNAAKGEALAYSAGVVLTCLLLGAVILLFRHFGVALGWSFQLQHPAMIFFLFVLSAAMTASLAGVLHLRGFGSGEGLVSQGGNAGAFWTGALAAFVATPCTGPFMAAALGAALVLPSLAALLIFGGLGLGLAIPFLLIGFVPSFRRWIPKPGPWMIKFQRVLAVPMGLTALALLWLIWRQTGALGLGLVVSLTLVGIIFAHRRAKSAVLMGGVPLLLACAGAAVLGQSLPRVTEAARASHLGGKPFTAQTLAQLRAANKPVFAYFTADWCLTCKVNEKAAIETATVKSAFEAKGVEVLIGDWTNGDPAITRFLEEQGRNGVPLYLAYKPGATQPVVLPQLLSPQMLVDAF